MTKIDTAQYMMMDEAAKAVGCSRRALYRAMHRAGFESVTAIVFEKRLVLRDKLGLIKANYFPYNSEGYSKMAKVWGAAGGSTKAANRRKAQKG